MDIKKKKIIIFTGDDMFYVPLLLEDLIRKHKKDISHIYISKSFLSINKIIKKMNFFLKNNYPFCISIKDWLNFFILHFKLRLKSVIKNKPKNVSEFFSNIGIKNSYVNKVNIESFYKLLKDDMPDIIILACFDKIVSKELCKIAKYGTFNVHLGKLPEYKGGLSAFWVLRFQDKIAGASIHKVTPEIDSGPLIAEKHFYIDTKSMHNLMLKTMQESSEFITKTINDIYDDNINEIDIRGRESKYVFYPSKYDFKKFYENGCRLI